MPNYFATALWRNALYSEPGDQDHLQKERLRSSYARFWDAAATLAQQIQKDLPHLTLHDEAHFDALWERADQIAGADYRLTPLEAFVFGGAILLHDAANTVAAFPGRLAEIEETDEYKDALADWLENQEPDAPATVPPSARGAILLDTLRALHAQRAETLASFEVAINNTSVPLVDDSQLRMHLGRVMGLIAASHHWDIAALPKRLPERLGALAGMPVSWGIRPILLACLLRCADANQLDQVRAPDFLFGLLRLRGVSETHWRAQNRLAKPLVDDDDPHALRFTSTRPFEPCDAEAWWIAHDAIAVANRELRASQSLMRDLRLPPFAVDRIVGAETPDRLAEQVSVTGWRPVAAEVRVSRVERIVDMFGGEKLYGQHMSVPVRELIQNAADAIRLRRQLEPAGSVYEGTITVRMVDVPDGAGAVMLSVEDDGIGMSEAVLTGPLIDFGTSYTSSALVKAERPGLLAKGRRRRIGEFGVGFFSSFMISDEVDVASRPFDQGLEACRTLRFSNGIVTRPLLLKAQPADFSASSSSRVTLKVSAETITEVLTVNRGWSRDGGTKTTLVQLVGTLCPMLDVDVQVEEGGRRTVAHQRRWMDEDRATWLGRLRVPHTNRIGDVSAEETAQAAAAQLRFVDETDPSAGLAAIIGVPGLGVATVGTLKATPRFGNEHRDDFAGAIDFLPLDAGRSEGRARAADKLPSWATEQARLVAAAGAPFPRRQWAAERVAAFGGDATPIAGLRLGWEWASVEEVFAFLLSGESLFAPVKAGFKPDDVLITVVRERHTGSLDSYREGELELLVNALQAIDNAGGDEALYRVPSRPEATPVSFCSLLIEYAIAKGYDVEGEILPKVEFARYIGEPSPRQFLEKGRIIATSALKLSLRGKLR